MMLTLTVACDGPQKKALQAAYDLDIGIAATQTVVESLNRPDPATGVQLLPDEDYLGILEAERDVLKTNAEFREILARSGEITPANKYAVIQLLDTIADSLGRLHTAGITRIKNKDRQVKFSLGLNLARTSIATLRVFLENLSTPVKIPPGSITK